MPPRKKQAESKETKSDAITDDDLAKSLEGDKLLFSEGDNQTAQVSHTFEAEEETHTKHESNHHKKVVHKRDDGISINLHLNKLTLERSVYWIIILILAYIAVFNAPLLGDRNTGEAEAVNPLFVVGENSTEEELEAQPEAKEEESEEQEPETTDTTQQQQTQQEEKTCSNNGIALTIEEIRMSPENEREIINIILRITNNNNNVLNEFLVEVLSREAGDTTSFIHTKNYDTSTTAASDGPARFTSQNVAKCGGTRTINLGSGDLAKRFISRESDVRFTGNVLRVSDQEILASAERTLRRS